MTPRDPRIQRLRRLKRTPLLRELVAETTLAASDLCWPLFVVEGLAGSQEIPSLPGQSRHGVDSFLRACDAAAEAGVRSIIVFGVPSSKDAGASSAFRDDGVVQAAVRAVKERGLPLTVMTDVCLCQYTDHGHCGILRGEIIDNDATLPVLARIASSHAAAGADVVAPSDMMDGRVGAMRAALDAQGATDVAILSYAVKYASAYYGPFRQAAESVPAFGDRRTHQMDPANRREALRAARRDVDEGADMVMVKPALAYLDIVREVRDAVDVPVAAYSVSGEHAMIEAAARAGWVAREAIVLETLLSMRRAGADLILSYHAVEAARLLRASGGA